MPVVTLPLNVGLAPDLDPAAPGTMFACTGMESVGAYWRMRRKLTAIATVSSANFVADSYVLDGFVADIVDGTEVRYIAVFDKTAAKIKIYQDISGTLTDKSRGAAYTAAGTENFSFAQYGNYTIATNLVDVLQIRDASGSSAFADSGATGIPKAKIAVTWGPPTSPRLMLLDYNDGTHYADGWWSSSTGGPTAAWTPDVATGAANGRLIGAGPIRCGIAYNDSIVAWGDRQMWVGTYIGPPYIVRWQRVSTEIGCVGPYAARVVNGTLYWLGDQGLYQFDGGSISRVNVPVQTYFSLFLRGISADTKRLTQLAASSSYGPRLTIAIRGAAPRTSEQSSVNFLVNLTNNRIGNAHTRVGAATTPLLSCFMDRNLYATIDQTATPKFEMWQEDQDHAPVVAVSDGWGFQTNFIGSNYEDTLVRSLTPRFTFGHAPASFGLFDSFGAANLASLSNTSTTTVSASPWSADFLKSARWHSFTIYLATTGGTTDPQISDLAVDVTKAGER